MTNDTPCQFLTDWRHPALNFLALFQVLRNFGSAATAYANSTYSYMSAPKRNSQH